jgi:hypothetical protein
MMENIVVVDGVVLGILLISRFRSKWFLFLKVTSL